MTDLDWFIQVGERNAGIDLVNEGQRNIFTKWRRRHVMTTGKHKVQRSLHQDMACDKRHKMTWCGLKPLYPSEETKNPAARQPGTTSCGCVIL